MTRKFVAVYEAQADLMTATELADRVLLEQIDWLDEALLDYQRQWIGEEPPGSTLTWKSFPNRARELGIRVHGHFNGEPGRADAQAARRAIVYVLRQLANVDAILLVRDGDDQAERQRGLEQARALYLSECTIVIGVAIPERECWVISGFQPADEEEANRLALERQSLGWDPCLRSHQLTAGKDDQAKRSPKRVLKALTDGNSDRQRDCWQSTPLKVLKERGNHNGLASYLEEVRLHLVPLITGYKGKPENP